SVTVSLAFPTRRSSDLKIVQFINGRARVLIAHAEFQSQILAHLPVVLEKVKLIFFLVVDRWITSDQDDLRRSVSHEPGGGTEPRSEEHTSELQSRVELV